MIRIYLFGLILILAQIVNAQEWNWVLESFGKTNNGVLDIEKDNKDNTIVLLFYSQNTEDHGMYLCDSIFHQQSSQFGDNGRLLIKLDPNGKCLWSINLIGEGILGAEKITIDSEDNILIPGYLNGGIEIDGQTIGFPGKGIGTGVILKLNQNGKLLWHKEYHPFSPNGVACRFISTDRYNNIYFDLATQDDSILIGNRMYYTKQDSIFYSSFIVKMNAEGIIQWVTPIGNSRKGSWVLAYNISITPTEQLIVSGIYSSEWMSIDGQRVYCSLPYNGNYGNESFISTLDPVTGKVRWLISFGGTRDDQVWEVKSDSKGNLYASIAFYSPKLAIGRDTIFHFGERNGGLRYNSALISFDSDGSFRWYRQFESMYSQGKFGGIAIDKIDNVWFNMQFATRMDWYGYTFKPIGVLDCAYLKFNSEGTLIDTFSLGGENNLMATGPIEVMNNGDLVIGSFFTGDSLTIGDDKVHCESWDGSFKKKAYDSFIGRFTPRVGVGNNNPGPSHSKAISIHPNPARDLIQILFDEDLSVDDSVEILTTTGTLMKSINIGKGSTSTTIDVRDWPAGVYFVRYQDIEGRSSVSRVVVE